MIDILIVVAILGIMYWSANRGLARSLLTLASILIIVVLAAALYPLLNLIFQLIPMLATALAHSFGDAGLVVNYAGQFIVVFNQISPTIVRICLLIVLFILITTVRPYLTKHLTPYIEKRTTAFTKRITIRNHTLRIDRMWGGFVGILSGLSILAILLIIIILSPFEAQAHATIHGSRISRGVLMVSLPIQSGTEFILSAGKTKLPTTLTTDASERDIKSLGFVTTNTTNDEESARVLFDLLNSVRQSNNLPVLSADQALHDIAAARGSDMFARGYFSHFTPEGHPPFELDSALIPGHKKRGENIAFTQEVRYAHSLLMNSPGHRENILFPTFTKVGIAVIDGGSFGKMFVQEFSE